MRLTRRGHGHHKRVDLTPMIDVVFQLIIFFMVTSHLGDLRRTRIDLPTEQGQQSGQRDAAMIVDINHEGRYLLDSSPVALEELVRVARAGLEDAPDSDAFDVLVRPDKDTPAMHLDRLLSRLSGAGVTRWRMGTRGVEGGGS